ncbi:MAG: general secretion pathway protein GspB [Gammaproteobacteria bacterium]|nr:general secretion pathway protein GspB [Gammaproteobacteria bacterium]
MSFILDALKKSENDRQRRSGPALFEVKVAAPRTGLPPWAIAIAVLLLVNLGVVMWMLLRHSGHGATAADTVPAAAPAAPTGATPPVTGATTTASPPAPAPPVSAASASPARAAASPAPPATAPAATSSAAGASGGTPSDQTNPEDYAPAEEPPAQPLGGHVQRGTASGVPLYQDAAATPGTQIPQLRLDLHVYALRAQDRFVMINMRKLREGESLPEGVRVESITPEGAVLSYNGSRFLLTRE